MTFNLNFRCECSFLRWRHNPSNLRQNIAETKCHEDEMSSWGSLWIEMLSGRSVKAPAVLSGPFFSRGILQESERKTTCLEEDNSSFS